MDSKKFSFEISKFRNSGKGPCIYCKDGIMESGMEGFFCMNCGHIINLCEKCPSLSQMKLLNFYYSSENKNEDEDIREKFSELYPIENVGKEYIGLISEYNNGSYYVDDQTLFMWKCIDCGNVEITECD